MRNISKQMNYGLVSNDTDHIKAICDRLYFALLNAKKPAEVDITIWEEEKS